VPSEGRPLKTPLGIVVAAALLGWACGGLSQGPTDPEPETDRGSVTPAPRSEASTPVLGTPTTAPSPDAEGGGDGTGTGDGAGDGSGDGTGNDGSGGVGGSPPGSSNPSAYGCSDPIPPEVTRLNVKVHVKGPDFWILDSTPLVGPNAQYCAQIGFTDGREYCPVRPEGHPEREGCEAWAVGTARDTGRTGPTWTRNGFYCKGPASGCVNAENQYQVYAYASGAFQACARNGACGEVDVSK